MKKSLAPLLASEPGKPPTPVAIFGVPASADGFDFSRSNSFGHVGEAFVAEFGDQAPTTGKSPHPVGTIRPVLLTAPWASTQACPGGVKEPVTL